MKDQVEHLLQKNIPAAAIHSGMTQYEVRRTLEETASGQYKFLYLSPERLESGLFTDYLEVFNVCLIAVDEAHCISQWGYDFRPPYLRIAQLRKALPGVPVLALTASATPFVQDDIIDKLQLKAPGIFRQSFSRPNLSYSVFNTDSKINKIISILNNVPGSSIIYCRNRRLTKETAHLLGLHKISADFYHAGLTQEERNARHEAWISNATRVMVCTNAFVPILPCSIVTGPDGVYPVVWRYDATSSDAVFHIDATEVDGLPNRPEIQRVGRIQSDRSRVANDFTLQYARSGMDASYAGSVSIGATSSDGVLADTYCALSQRRYRLLDGTPRVVSWSGTSDVIYDDSTAILALQWRARAYGFTIRRIAYDLPERDYGWIEPGHVGTVTDTNWNLTNALVLVESATIDGTGYVRLALRILDDPTRDLRSGP